VCLLAVAGVFAVIAVPIWLGLWLAFPKRAERPRCDLWAELANRAEVERRAVIDLRVRPKVPAKR
jgi:cytochrome c oxidase assembly factor CtaG